MGSPYVLRNESSSYFLNALMRPLRQKPEIEIGEEGGIRRTFLRYTKERRSARENSLERSPWDPYYPLPSSSTCVTAATTARLHLKCRLDPGEAARLRGFQKQDICPRGLASSSEAYSHSAAVK